MRKLITIITLLILSINSLHARRFINKEWEQLSTATDSIDYTTNTLDSYGNLLVCGNKLVAGQNANLTITKYSSTGSVTWQQTYNGIDNNKDYGTAVITDNSNNVYVAGTSFSSVSNFDMVIIKYNSSGTQQWIKIFNGIGNSLDVPTAIALDNSNNLYVTGISYGATSQSDYCTIKLNTSGVQTWVQYYDYASLHEVPSGISIVDTNVYITGASESSTNNWDFTTVKYSTNGYYIDENRVNAPGTGFDKPSDIMYDNSGNIIITGSAYDSMTASMNIKTIKLNPNLGLIWVKSFDFAGLDDGALSLEVDNNGNIYLAGFVTNTSMGKDIIVIKYDANGNLMWSEVFDEGTVGDAYGTKLALNSSNDLYIVGKSVSNSSFILTMKMNSSGQLLWEKQYTALFNSSSYSPDISINSNGDVYVSGAVYNGLINQIATIKYSELEVDNDVLYNGSEPDCRNNEIVIRFHKSSLIDLPYTTKDIVFGKVGKFVKPSVISAMEAKLNMTGLADADMYKVFRNLTKYDTVTTDKFGNPNYIPDFWTEMILLLPEPDLAYTTNDLKEFCDSLNTMPGKIKFACKNAVFKLSNNDFYYHNDSIGIGCRAQNNLHNANGLYPNAHVNYEAAAAKGVFGSPFTRVGIMDSRVEYDHEDFKDGLGNSCIKGGIDYDNFNQSIFLTNYTQNDIYHHGTSVTGIIAGRTNNNVGISGIAGANDSVGTDGVSIYASTVAVAGLLYYSTVAEAMVDYSDNNGPFGAMDIINNSWGYRQDPHDNYQVQAIREKYRFSHKQGVINVCARGNKGKGEAFADPSNNRHGDYFHFPSTFNDDWVISVGATGYDGQFLYKTLNAIAPSDSFFSMWGKNVDVMAPGSVDVVTSISTNTDASTHDKVYDRFSGTSAATPHVTGLSALMIDYAKSPLAPEDMERLIEYSSTDLTDTTIIYDTLNTQIPVCTAGYDQRTGWGRINIGNALNMLDSPKWVYHVDISMLPIPTSSQVKYNFTFPYGFDDENGDHHDSLNQYTVIEELYEIKKYHSFSPGAYIIESAGKPGVWVRNSFSNLWGNDGEPETKQTIVSYDIDSAVIRAYRYKLLVRTIGGVPYDSIPGSPYATKLDPNGKIRMGYSVYVYDTALVSIPSNVTSLNQSGFSMSLYPNPTQNVSQLKFYANNSGEITVCIYTVDGKKVKQMKSRYENGENRIDVSLHEFPTGLYFIEAKADKEIKQVFKLLKQ